MATEFQFEQPNNMPEEEEEQEVGQEEEPTEEETEAEPEAEPDPTESRLGAIEEALEKVTRYLSEKEATPKPAEAKAPTRQKPNFGDNTVAAALWDELQEVKRAALEPWERLEKQKQEDKQVEQAFAQLMDDANRYIDKRKGSGDPEVEPKQLAEMLISMGQLANRRIPIDTAMKNAYNAIAFEAAKDQTRNRAFSEARKPTASIPTFKRQAGSTGQNPQARTNPSSKPGDSKPGSLKARVDAANARLARLSPEDIEEAFGN